MKRYNLSKIMKVAHMMHKLPFNRSKSFSEMLKKSWARAKSERKASESTPTKTVIVRTPENDCSYNDLTIPSSDFYSNSRGYLNSSYVGD